MHSGDVLADRFVIEHLAGSGGMGEVFRAWDPQSNQPVAVKVLRGDALSDLARFEREVRILSEIDDPRVVRHIAHGTSVAGDPYLVMEWLEGEDLAKRLARGRIDPTESIRLCADVASAIGALHERGIVHRDLKPSNVFLVHGQTTHVKLLDLGIARIESSTRMTGTGTLVGTFGYMAPEQANGTTDLDARADVFALGCVLFECIAGEPAFGGTHPMAILTKILFEDAPRLGDRRAGIPSHLDMLVGRLLSKNRDERPRNGHAVAEALRALGDVPACASDETQEIKRPPALTDSERRAVAVILVSAAAPDSETNDGEIVAAAQAHGASCERLWDGSLALLLSTTGIATDLASQGAWCALAVGARAQGRRVVFALGRAHGKSFVSMGPAIDQAARLMGVDGLERGIVAVDDAAVGLLDARFDVRDESGVYVLVGERDVAEVRTLLGKPTPCVGRERELRMLDGFFDDCTADDPRAHAVLVTAPPGVGKSRIGREFLQKVRTRNDAVSVWMARGEPLRAGSAFALAAQLVETAAGIQRGETVDVRREKLRVRVAQRVSMQDCQRVTDFLGEMIGTPFPDDNNLPLRAARGAAQLMNDQLRRAFVDFLDAECASNPVVIFLEDLHWGDAPTVDVLGRALGDLMERPLFVLALARPNVHEVFPALWTGRPMQEIRMSELSKKAAERLARHVLGPHVPDKTIQKVVDLSVGNAFYLEELLRATVEGHGDDLPETVVAMVQSRIESLSDAERRWLRAASIFGETCWTSAVSTLLGTMHASGDKIDEKLRALVNKELFIQRTASRFPNETEYAFRHALLREGTYAMLTPEDRTLGHRLAGEWLERMGEGDPVVLAEHFEKGNHHEQAGRYWLAAGQRMGWSGDPDEGIRYIEHALSLQTSPALREQMLGVFCELHVYRIETAHRALHQANELLRTADRGSNGWPQAQLIALICAAQTGDVDTFQRLLAESMLVEVDVHNAHPVALLLGLATCLMDFSGQVDTGARVYKRLDTLLHPMAEQAPIANVFRDVIASFRVLHAHQDVAGGYTLAKATSERSRLLGHSIYASGGHVIAASCAFGAGAHDLAIAMLECPDDADAKLGVATSIKPFVLAWALADLQRFATAKEWAERLVNTGQSRQLPLDEARGHWVLAEVLRRQGDLDIADREIAAAVSMLRLVCPLDLPGALGTLAALRLAQNRPNEALDAAAEGMAKVEAMSGSCSQFFRNAFLRLAHAESLEACGRHEDAMKAIAAARDWVLHIGATIDDAAFKTSFIENVPENRRILELAAQWVGTEQA